LRKFKVHITLLLLILTGNFVLPAKYWHVHEHEHQHEHARAYGYDHIHHSDDHHDPDGDILEEVCSICDFVLATPILDSQEIALTGNISFTPYSAVTPAFVLAPSFTLVSLRGPPIETV